MKNQTKSLSAMVAIKMLWSIIDGLLKSNRGKVGITMKDLNGLLEQSINMLRQAFNNVSYIRLIPTISTLLSHIQTKHLLKEKVELLSQKQNELFGKKKKKKKMIGTRL